MFSRKKLFIAVTGLVSFGLLATLAPLVSLGQNTPIDTRRSFYLTKATHKGFAGETACALGYHMASLWEIHEPSNLSYNTTLGLLPPRASLAIATTSPAIACGTGRWFLPSGDVSAPTFSSMSWSS